MKPLSLPALAVAALLFAATAQAGDVTQIDVAALLNIRPISAIVNGTLVVQSNDLDGAGGLATKSAALTQEGAADPHALPDDAKFPANDKHPDVVLSYGTDDGTKGQARKSIAYDTFTISVPEGNYTKLLLILTSSQGASNFEVDLKYKDNSIETKSLEVPDWTDVLKDDDKYRCYIATDLSKWNQTRKLKPGHHSIFGIDLQPNPDKILVKVRIRRGEKGLMTFFGATAEQKTVTPLGTP